MTDQVELLIVGAGPTGLTAAIDAALQGLSVRIIDQGAGRTEHSRALVIHSRTLEVFDDLGCVGPVLSAGRPFRALNLIGARGGIGRIDFGALDWRDAPYPMWLTLPQSETERCLESSLAALGVQVERRTFLVSLAQDASGVSATLCSADEPPRTCRASWVLGSDGARSEVRRQLAVPLEGEAGTDVFVLADVEAEAPLVDGEGYNVLSSSGVLLIVPLQVPGRVRLIAHLPELRPDDPLPPLDLPFWARLLEERAGVEARLLRLGWTSTFSPKHLLAERFRAGRVFLAGDAAHLHSPVGGQGLNTGVQDAYNLVWKLAAVQRGRAPHALLDSYEHERRAIASGMLASVRRATRAVTLRSGVARAARNTLASLLLSQRSVRDRFGPDIGMLRLRYPAGYALGEDLRGGSGARVGERAPLLASAPELTEALRGVAHSLLLFGEEATSRASAAHRLARGFGARVLHITKGAGGRGPDALVDPEGRLSRAFGAADACAVWVRPDKYIGFRGDPWQEGPLSRYLDRLAGPRTGTPGANG